LSAELTKTALLQIVFLAIFTGLAVLIKITLMWSTCIALSVLLLTEFRRAVAPFCVIGFPSNYSNEEKNNKIPATRDILKIKKLKVWFSLW